MRGGTRSPRHRSGPDQARQEARRFRVEHPAPHGRAHVAAAVSQPLAGSPGKGRGPEALSEGPGAGSRVCGSGRREAVAVAVGIAGLEGRCGTCEQQPGCRRLAVSLRPCEQCKVKHQLRVGSVRLQVREALHRNSAASHDCCNVTRSGGVIADHDAILAAVRHEAQRRRLNERHGRHLEPREEAPGELRTSRAELVSLITMSLVCSLCRVSRGTRRLVERIERLGKDLHRAPVSLRRADDEDRVAVPVQAKLAEERFEEQRPADIAQSAVRLHAARLVVGLEARVLGARQLVDLPAPNVGHALVPHRHLRGAPSDNGSKRVTCLPTSSCGTCWRA
mmetsp:Transcript_44298/g.123186  ORF Transcript_44298/g.123186 Transcript_44298/m.123186 type:complete len:336 (-) Transcript_44298:1966-2973(-)